MLVCLLLFCNWHIGFYYTVFKYNVSLLTSSILFPLLLLCDICSLLLWAHLVLDLYLWRYIVTVLYWQFYFILFSSIMILLKMPLVEYKKHILMGLSLFILEYILMNGYILNLQSLWLVQVFWNSLLLEF